MSDNIRMHLIITGRVQGVCFRIATKKEAEKHKLFGWVKNKKDGTVEAVFEGEKQKVDSMINWCRQGPPGADVFKLDVELEVFTVEFDRFEIIY